MKLQELRKRILSHSAKMKYNHKLQSIGYPEEIKKAIVAHHYENNVSYGNLSILIYGTKSGQSTFRTWHS